MEQRLFGLPNELVDQIFEAIVRTRRLNRALRLRLVNSDFKYFVEGAIIRLRSLQKARILTSTPSWSDVKPCDTARRQRFFVEYMAYHAWVEQDPTSTLGRIRHVAVALAKDVGECESNKSAVMSRLQPLCRLALDYTPGLDRDLFDTDPMRSTKVTAAQQDEDVCVGAIYLGHRYHIEDSISRSHELGHLREGDIFNVNSDIFGSAVEAAARRGDVSMVRLVLTSSPHCDPPKPINLSMRRRILECAALFGFREVFDFALDGGFSDLVSGEHYTLALCPEYRCLHKAIATTPILSNYLRGAAMFQPDGKAFKPILNGDLGYRLAQKSRHGHVDMVHYFLAQGASPHPEVCPRTGALRHWPLGEAVASGETEITRLLLQRGADPNYDPASMFTLLTAARAGYIAIARLLLEAGARVDDGLPPPIVMAVFNEDMPLFRMLRQHGARLDTPETGGWAMALAQSHGLDSMIELLVEEGVEPDAVFQRRSTLEELN